MDEFRSTLLRVYELYRSTGADGCRGEVEICTVGGGDVGVMGGVGGGDEGAGCRTGSGGT